MLHVNVEASLKGTTSVSQVQTREVVAEVAMEKEGDAPADVPASGREGLEYYIMSRKIIAVSRTSNTCQILGKLGRNRPDPARQP